ncbi:hypothetical protein BDY24DRAFT_380702 [Mrakia frigida]|uniref:UV-damaged DNA-binding protein RAD7 n=1 Tax=Mrakia frigida TaxID=29902 RepID=UPI003FCBFD34
MPPRRNGVSGPTSAMTAYLKEQGIVGRTGVNYNPAPAAAADPPANAEAGPSNSTYAVAGSSSRRPTDLIDLDEEDEAEDSDQLPQKAGTKRKKKIINIDDSDDLDGDDDYSTSKNKNKNDDDSDSDVAPAPPPKKKGAPAPGKKKVGGGGRPANGSITACGECGAKVTVTNYSPPSPNDPSAVLCRPCAIAAGLGDYKGPAAAKKAAAKKAAPPAQRRKIVHYEEKARILTLKDLTIEVIAKNVEDVESLGNIGSANMEKVNDIICKHRKMTSQTAQLFYDVELKTFTMKDCTNIDPRGFLILSNLCPNLTSLTLNLCGQLTDEPLVYFSTQLPSLTRLELLGPFLVRKQAWIDFFTNMGSRLEGFLVRQSPRLDLECISALAENCGTNLTELRLSECGKMEGSWLSVLAQGGLKKLQHLDLSYPLNPLPSGCSDLEELIVAIGPNLLSLNLAGQSLLTSKDLYTLLPLNLLVLTRLDLTLLPLLTEEGVAPIVPAPPQDQGEEVGEDEIPVEMGTGMAEVFRTWEQEGNVGLESVKMGKAHQLKGATLQALVGLAGEKLRELEITGWKDVEEEVVKELGKTCKGLMRLDLGWCRNVTDFTLKQILEDAENLQEVIVWGCNLITINHPRKKGVKIAGVESHQF